LGSSICQDKGGGSPEKEYFTMRERKVHRRLEEEEGPIRPLCREGEEEDGGRSFTTS